MVPLVRVEAVPEETTLAGAIEIVRREGFSRIPVFHKRIFNIVGVRARLRSARGAGLEPPGRAR